MNSVLLAGAVASLMLLPSPYPDTTYKAMYYTSYTLSAVDWAQTRYISTHPYYSEVNPLLGEHPSTARVDNYFAAWWVVTQVALRVLPEKWSRAYLAGKLVVNVACVSRNIQIGIGVDF